MHGEEAGVVIQNKQRTILYRMEEYIRNERLYIRFHFEQYESN